MQRARASGLTLVMALFLSSCAGYTIAPNFQSGGGASPSGITTLSITTTSLPPGQVGSSYSATVDASGGTAPYNWTLQNGSLPPGVALDQSSGTIDGMPGKSGNFSMTVGVQDSSTPPKTTTRGLSLSVTASSVGITTTSLPSGAVGVSYSATLSAANGVVPYTWSVTSGQVPPGLSLQSGGQITGTPSQAGTFSFAVQVRDSSGNTATASFSVTVAGASTPVVTGISPSSGPTSGGTTVTIGGANFATGAAVTFGGTQAISVTVSSSSQIQAVTPAHVAGTVGVIVEVNGQSSSSSAGFTYAAAQTGPPTISGVAPTSGPPGTQVTVTGTNFGSGDVVAFGGTNATLTTFVSGTQLSATVPSLAAGTYDVAVLDPAPASATLSNAFTITSPQPAGNQSLLSGCTVDSNNVPSCSIPSGWTLVRAEGFESGALGTGEYGRSGCNTLDTVSSAMAHTGTYSWVGNVCGDGDDPTWGLAYQQVGSFNDLYVSSWTYLSPGAHIETGNFYFHRFQCCSGNFNQELLVNLDNFATQPTNACCGEAGNQVPTITNPWVDFVGQSSCYTSGCNPIGTEIDFSQYVAKQWNLNAGFWQQNETWVHFNTCANNTPNSDGFYRFYINGNLLISQNNVNLIGCWPMSGQTNVEVGGVDTVTITEDSSGNCVGGDGSTVPPGGRKIQVNPFSSAPALEADGVTPCVPHVNIQQYSDDIVILSK